MKALKYGIMSVVMCGGMATAHAYSGPEITFENILENPSDRTLNMNYAKQQEQKGDIVSALAAVERLLFDNSEDDSLRLYYASLLLKADDVQGARRELKALEVRDLAGSNQAKYQRLRRESGMGQAVVSSSPSKLRGMIAVGARYDDSAGEALADGAAALTTSSSDIAAFVQGALQFRAPVQNDSGTVVHGGINGQTLRHETFSRVDYDTLGANLGLSGGTKSFYWHLDGQFQKVYVDNQAYLTQAGPTLKLATHLSPATKLIATGTYMDQDFDDLRSTFGEEGRSGEKISGSIGIRHKMSDKTVLGAEVGYTDKDAGAAFFAYNGLFANIDMQHGFENGAYFRGYGSYQDLDYQGGLNRNDDRLSGGLTLGAPVSKISESMGATSNPAFDDISLEGTVRYTERSSNLVGVGFDSFGAEMRLIWNF